MPSSTGGMSLAIACLASIRVRNTWPLPNVPHVRYRRCSVPVETSEATINVKGRLDSVLSGASRLYFHGNPTMGNTEVSGASTIKHK